MTYNRVLAVAAALTLLTAQVAQAFGPHDFSRHMGFGWGDGYHAQAACPPRKPLWASPACPACAPGVPVHWSAAADLPSSPPVSRAASRQTPGSLFPHWDKQPSRR
jgi:hypothetical protein